MWMGIDIGTGGSRALLVDAQRRGARRVHGAARRHAHGAAAVGRAASRELVGRGRRRPSAASSRKAGVSGDRGARHRPFRPDARAGDARRSRPGDPPVADLVRSAQPAAGGLHQRPGRAARRCCDGSPTRCSPASRCPNCCGCATTSRENFERVRKMLLPKDYVRFRLTGEFATEVSDASGTALFDVVHRRWSFEMMDGAGPRPRHSARSATNRARSPAESRPRPRSSPDSQAGTPVVGGGGDQAASAVGNGIVEAGIVSCTLGTSGVVFAHMEKVAYDPAGRVHTFCHAVRDKWHVMGVTQGAGLSLQWFRNQLAPGDGLRRAHRRSRRSARRLAGSVLAALPDGRAHAAPGCHRPRRLDRAHGAGTRAPTSSARSSKASPTASAIASTSSSNWASR